MGRTDRHPRPPRVIRGRTGILGQVGRSALPERARRLLVTWGRTVVFAAAGALIGITLGSGTRADIGPFECTVVARPSFRGDTTIGLAPLGSVELDTHTAPIALELRVDELRPEAAQRIASDPAVLATLEDRIAADAEDVLRALVARALLAAAAGGLLGALAARASARAAAVGVGTGVVLAGGIAVVAALTFRPSAIAEPEYTGLLTVAPRAVGDVEAVVERFDDYRAQLTELVGNVVTIYRAAEGLPSLDTGDDAIRVLHVSDIHNNPQGFDLAEELVDRFDVDVVVDTGDLTDWGTPSESRLLDRVGGLGAPYVYVRGNHDSRQTQRAVAAEGALVLDGGFVDVAGLRIWGIGDPRYTPDKGRPTGTDVEAEQLQRFAPGVRGALEDDGPDQIDLVAVHDARSAAEIGDLVPLVLAGHTHSARQDTIDDALLLIEGSTGGAGLRGLQGGEPEPLACSILYFDPGTDRLVAYDRVTVDGFGGTGARIERHVVDATD